MACAQPTQLLVVLENSDAPAATYDAIDLAATGPDGMPLPGGSSSLAARSVPISFAVVPHAARDAVVSVGVVAHIGSATYERRFTTRFRPARRLAVHVDLSASCEGVSCPSDQTCRSGTCSAIDDMLDAGVLDAGGARDVGALLDTGGADAGGCPSDWWDRAFSRRSRYTYGTATSSEVADVPVPIGWDTATFDYLRDDGDLRFAMTDGTQLPFDVDHWDQGAARNALAWVRVPAIGGSVRELGMYYGNPTAGSVADPSSVWADERVVLHLEDLSDASGHGNAAAGSATSAPGLFGGAQHVAVPQYFVVPIGDLGDFTISFWAYFDSAGHSEPNLVGVPRVFTVGRAHTGAMDVLTLSSSSGTISMGHTAITAGAWFHASIVRAGTSLTLNYFGAPEATVSEGTPIAAGSLLVGGMYGWSVDELRVAPVARSRSWFSAEAAVASPPFVQFVGRDTCIP
jgi:hypothetical protein